MKPIRSLLAGFFMVLTMSLSVLAAPPTGTWLTPDHFAAGTWKEILSGGGEGKLNNEITAASTAYYKFQGALLSEFKKITESTACTDGEYETKYIGGTLELVTGVTPADGYPLAPWYISPTSDPYIVDLGETVVKTCKYSDSTMSFSLQSSGIFRDMIYPSYIAEISANYSGTPIYTPQDTDGYASLSGDIGSAQITITGLVGVDIKPGSCPNPVNVKSRGVLPVAILGGADFNVQDIDLNSLSLTNGVFINDSLEMVSVKPLRVAREDVATPYDPLLPREDPSDCHTAGSDGYTDLTLKFDTQALVSAFGLVNGSEDKIAQEWFLMFKLMDGTEMQGSDVVWILNKKSNGNQFGRRKRHRY